MSSEHFKRTAVGKKRLLARHIREFPQDYSAYEWLPKSSRKLKVKALALAQSELSEESR